MPYIKVTFKVAGQEASDMLTALLADAGYDGFEEFEAALLAYIEEPKFSENELNQIARVAGATYETEVIPDQNWNAVWESNFEPVIIPGFCTIRAHFHDIAITTPYDILITPKMSFGTGHHATTQLMMLMMRTVDFTGRSVLDFGTGTGVLAILAEKLGAAKVTGIDNDTWCVENALENVERNNCRNVIVRLGSLEDISIDKPDIILANINRHILIKYMRSLYATLSKGGTIIMSGLLADDKEIIVEAATSAGFTLEYNQAQMNWISLSFSKT